MKKTFLAITERNQWEGETWHYLFKNTKKNKAFYKAAKKHVEKDSSYSFQVLEYEEKEEKQNANHPNSKTTYKAQYTIIKGEFDFQKGLKTLDNDEKKDPFYKGQFEKFRDK